jgi:hypothetical protein
VCMGRGSRGVRERIRGVTGTINAQTTAAQGLANVRIE